jgi:hypothetical protein
MADIDEIDSNDEANPKDLRKQLAKEKKEKQELLDRLASLEKQERSRTVSDLLSEKGLPTKLAGLIPDSATESRESVEAWLTEYADVFGSVPPSNGAPDPDEGKHDDMRAASQRIANATAGGTAASRPEDLEARMKAATTLDELNAIIRSASV